MSATVIFGAGGGIGRALVDHYAAKAPDRAIFAVSRRAVPDAAWPDCVQPRGADITDEAALARLAQELRDHRPDQVILATGRLSDGAALQPEKSLRHQSAAQFEALFAANTIGPALVAKHLLPLMPREGRFVFAALSARVGSIGDNRSGGWHGYRASKAALNMLMRCYAIEMARSHPKGICVTLHPGTVRTALSDPFLRSGDGRNVFTPTQAAEQLAHVIAGLRPEDSGQQFDWAGKVVPP